MSPTPSPNSAEAADPRFTLKPAELVAAIMAGSIGIDLDTYPDADHALYARISRDRRDRTPVERQLEIAIAYAQEHRLSYVIFSDRKSAYLPGVVRKDYNALLDAVRARRLKQVICYKIDRLYRKVEELMDLIKIADHGRVPVTLIGLDDDDMFDLTTARGCDEAIGRVLEAQKESRRTSERMRTQRKKAREQGIPNPGAPGFGWCDKYGHDEREAPVLAQAYESILLGTSVSAIVRKWNDAAFRGMHGGLFDVTSVKFVLMNPRNAGHLTHSYEAYDEKGRKRRVTEIVRRDVFKPIVDQETFDAVQRELTRRSRPQRHPRRRNMLTGLVRCVCGGPMTRTTVEGHLTYRCWKYRAGQKIGCGTTISAKYLEPFVEGSLFKYIDSPEFARTLVERSEVGTRRAELIAEKDRLSKLRDGLRERMKAHGYDDDLLGYERDVQELGEQLQDVSAQLAFFEPVHPAAVWAGNGAGLRDAWATRLDTDEKRAVIQDAFGTITVKRTTMWGRRFDPSRIQLGATFTAA